MQAERGETNVSSVVCGRVIHMWCSKGICSVKMMSLSYGGLTDCSSRSTNGRFNIGTAIATERKGVTHIIAAGITIK